MPRLPPDLCQIPLEKPLRHEGGGFVQEHVSWSECPPFLGLGIAAAGITTAGPRFRVSHCSPSWAVMVVLSGQGTAWIDGAWQPWTVHQALVLPSTRWHHYGGGHERWRIAWVVWRPGVEAPLPPTPVLRHADGELLAAAITGCRRERGVGYDRAVQQHWATLVDALARRPLAAAQDTRLDTLWAIVLGDLAAPWTLGDLARIAEMSPEALRLAVHRGCGRSPHAHLTWLRMRHAAALLTVGDEAVAAIAGQVGYENPFAFSVAFKRVIGLAPAVYRGQRHGFYRVPGDPHGEPPSRGGRGVARRSR